jgi:hypothetical protein
MAAIAAAAVEEAGELRRPRDSALPEARTLSSLRVHPDFWVSSAGQTTRLKFALCNIRGIFRSVANMRTWEMLRP